MTVRVPTVNEAERAHALAISRKFKHGLYEGMSRRERIARAAIDEFIDRYSREIDHHERLARTCKEHLESVLRQHGVKAIVTHRAKSPNRLYQKLLARLEKRRQRRTALYGNAEEVRDDIADLAGVRAALYFPGDRERIDEFIGRNMEVVERRHFPVTPSNGDTNRPGHPIFAGYIASHYRVYWHEGFRKSGVVEERDHLRPPGMVEVQVASVLMHAWAEVEHDLVYKPENGPLSREEYALLDQVNGLVLSGETALRLLQEATVQRLANDDTRHFADEAELFAYLEGKTFGAVKLLRSDKIGMLLIALRIVAANKPAAINELAKSIASPWRVHPVAQLLTQVMLENPPSIGAIVGTISADVWHLDELDERAELISAVDQLVGELRKTIGVRRGAEAYRTWRQTPGRRGARLQQLEERLDRFLRVPNPPTTAMIRSLAR